MVLEERDTGHAKVNVLSGLPAHLCWHGDLNCVLCHQGDSCLVANHEGKATWAGPVELEESQEVAKRPDDNRSIQVAPRHKVVLGMPKQKTHVRHRNRNM